MIFPEEIQMKCAGCIVLYMWWLTHSIMWWMSALLTQASARMPPNFYFKTNRNSLIFFLSKITRHFASNLDVHKIYLWYCDVLLSMRAQIWLKEKKCLDGIGKLRRLQSHQLKKKKTNCNYEKCNIYDWILLISTMFLSFAALNANTNSQIYWQTQLYD